MQLTQLDIDSFQDLWSAEFGEDITPQAAAVCAAELLALYSAITRTSASEKSADTEHALP